MTGIAAGFMVITVVLGMAVIIGAFCIADLRREIGSLSRDYRDLAKRHSDFAYQTGEAVRLLGLEWVPSSNATWKKREP